MVAGTELIGSINTNAIFAQVGMWSLILLFFALFGIGVWLVIRVLLYTIKVIVVERVGENWIIKGFDRGRISKRKGVDRFLLYKARTVLTRYEAKYFLPFRKHKAIFLALVDGNYYPITMVKDYKLEPVDIDIDRKSVV